MSINYAILGILSCNKKSGYDLKKIIQESPFMYWSGNSNQIYKALVELLNEGYVTNEVQHQDSLPSKKIYSITQDGLAALKDWVVSTVDSKEFKKPFLIQLAWSKQLNSVELNKLITGYENQIKMQIMLHKKSIQTADFLPNRTALETKIWSLIYENIESTYNNELNWIQGFRAAISEIENEADNDHLDFVKKKRKENEKMSYNVIKKDNMTYLHFYASDIQLDTEKDVIDIISTCAEKNANYVLFDEAALSDDFYNLRTGLAGAALQKFNMYGFHTAVYIEKPENIKGKFKDLLAESNQRGSFRSFTNITDAENWFICLNNERNGTFVSKGIGDAVHNYE